MTHNKKVQPFKSADDGVMFCSGKECSYFRHHEHGYNLPHCVRRGIAEKQELGETCAWFYVECTKTAAIRFNTIMVMTGDAGDDPSCEDMDEIYATAECGRKECRE